MWVSFNHFLTISDGSSLSLHQVNCLHPGMGAQCALHMSKRAQCSVSMWATVDCWFERKKEKQGIECLGAAFEIALLQGGEVGSWPVVGREGYSYCNSYSCILRFIQRLQLLLFSFCSRGLGFQMGVQIEQARKPRSYASSKLRPSDSQGWSVELLA